MKEGNTVWGCDISRLLLSALPVVLVPVEEDTAQVRARLTPVLFHLTVGHVPYPLEDRVDDLRWLLVSGIGWVPREGSQLTRGAHETCKEWYHTFVYMHAWVGNRWTCHMNLTVVV